MRGIVLIDQEIENNLNYIHFMIYRHGPEYDSSTCMYVMFIEDIQLKKTIRINWANVSFFEFLKTLQQLPMGKQIGTYYKYGPELEQMDWAFDEATGLYTLTFLDREDTFTIKASHKQIVQFGHALEKDMKAAPNKLIGEYVVD